MALGTKFQLLIVILARRAGTRQDRLGDDRATGEALPRELRQRGGHPHSGGRHRVRRTAEGSKLPLITFMYVKG